jgi:NH3-dependent NAD+ synthetase
MKTLAEIYEVLDLENNIKKPFTTFAHKILTYGELNQRVRKLVRYLQASRYSIAVA